MPPNKKRHKKIACVTDRMFVPKLVCVVGNILVDYMVETQKLKIFLPIQLLHFYHYTQNSILYDLE
jgi:hypothetical protein